jgi:hypothetical protein
MRRNICCLFAVGVLLSLACSVSVTLPSHTPSPSIETTDKVPSPTPRGQYADPSGQWIVAYGTGTWRRDAEDGSILHHSSLDCGLVMAGWPMGMEGPEAELFEMREKQVPVELGEHTFLRSILLARSDQAGYTGEIAYYLSEDELWAHIVLVLGKELYGKPEDVARCQQDAEAIVSTLSVG